MTNSDPLELLLALADESESPSVEFANELLGDLLDDLANGSNKTTNSDAKLENLDNYLATPDDFNSGRRHVRWAWPLLAAAAAIIAIIGFVAVSKDDDRTKTQDDSATTTTTTSLEAARSEEAENLSVVKTWEQYATQVEHWEVQQCASMIGLAWMPSLVYGSIESFYTDEPKEVLRLREEMLFFLDGFSPWVQAKVDLDTRHPAQRLSKGGISESAADQYTLDLWKTTQRTRANVEAAAAGTEVDVGELIFGLTQVDSSEICPIGRWVGSTPVRDELSTYASTAKSLGGMGLEAAIRCGATALLTSGLDELLDSGDLTISPRIGNYWQIYAAYWTDRNIDAEIVALIERWQALDLDDAELHPELQADIIAIRNDFLAFRQTAPDGAICPLEPS